MSVAVINTGNNSSGTTIGNLPDSVRLSLALAVVDSCSIPVPVAGEADSGDNASVVRVSGGVSIGQGKPVSDLSDGVGVSRALSIEASSVARVANSGDNADIVGM